MPSLKASHQDQDALALFDMLHVCYVALCVQVYDVLPFQVGPFLQSGLVPLVLAPIWVLYEYLQPLLDNLWPGVSLSHRCPAEWCHLADQLCSPESAEPGLTAVYML